MLNRSVILTMSTSLLKALPGELDIKSHSPSILYIPYEKNYFDIPGSEVIKLFSCSSQLTMKLSMVKMQTIRIRF